MEKKVLSKRKLMCAILAVVAMACLLVVGAWNAVPLAETEQRVNATTAADVTDAISKAVQYADETEIEINSNLALDGAITVGSAKSIRFVSDGGDRTVVFKGGLEIEAEAQVTFDVDVVFDKPAQGKTNNVAVNGTLTVNKKLHNATSVTVGNVVDEKAELVSRGIVVGGSFNNDAVSGGSVTLADGATFTTRESTTFSVRESGSTATTTYSNNDGGTLMLLAKNASLGFINNGGKLVNNGSVVYDKSAAAPLCDAASKGALTSATFLKVEDAQLATAGAKVIYPNTYELDAALNYPSAERTLTGTITFTASVSVMSFGKITYKLGADGSKFAVNAATSLGGGTAADGKSFTQGANELIFDGGAIWTRGNAVSYGVTTVGTIFYSEDDGQPYYYTNTGIKSDGNSSVANAFFNVTGVNSTFSIYNGTKLTDYAHTFGSATKGGDGNFGGALYVNGNTVNIYGGEISRCAVENVYNGSVGAGIYLKDNSTLNMYGGTVTRNAAATVAEGNSSGELQSADGSGIASKSSTVNLYNGDISYNHSALGGVDINADGGGLMLDGSDAFIYGGAIHHNFAGGSGGGICAWNSKLYMYGGEIYSNRAANGGGIGTTSDGKPDSTEVLVDGGRILNNEAFQNSYDGTKKWGGYGGGICLGSQMSPYGSNSAMTVKGDTLISGNKAYYGGGLAVWCQSVSSSLNNQLTMQGGLISGNAAYAVANDKLAHTSYVTPVTSHGGGVYIESTGSDPLPRPMLLLSGDASIDSSNAVSFNAEKDTISTKVTPIEINGKLTGSGLGALVYISRSDVASSGKWSGMPVINVSVSGKTASDYVNKFVFDTDAATGSDTTKYGFAVSNTNYLVVEAASSTPNENNAVAQIGTKYYASLADALADVGSGATATIEILKSATLTTGQLVIGGNRNVTIKPASGRDVTLVIASSASFAGTRSLFKVDAGSSLTIDGGASGNGRLTIDGNGTGRHLADANATAISLAEVEGSFTLTNGAYLRNNISGAGVLGSAVVVSGSGTFTMSGGVIEDNTAQESKMGSAIYLRDSAVFNWNGGTIQNNVTEGNAVNYGIYLSSNTSVLNINAATNAIALNENVIYVGAAHIEAINMSQCADRLGLVFPDVTTLDADTIVVSMGANDYSGKFYVAQAQEGLELGSTVASNNHYLRILRFVTLIFDMRYTDGSARTSAGIKISGLDDLITNIKQGDNSGITVKTRQGGYVLSVTMRSNASLSPAIVEQISNAYTREGYFTNGFTDDTPDHHTYNYNSAQSYSKSNVPITLDAVWAPKNYAITFNANVPAGISVNEATVVDSLPKLTGLTYENISDTDVNVIDNSKMNDIGVVGYAFSGWKTTADNSGKTLFAEQKVTDADILLFTAQWQLSRGTYTITAYADWTSIFGGGAGTSQNQFVISSQTHLDNLNKSLRGEEITLAGNVVYPSHDVNGYSGYYFSLSSNLTLTSDYTPFADGEETVFKGYFYGNFNTVTLAGNPLFDIISGAAVYNLVLAGTVSGSSGYVGALASVANSSTVSEVANVATVTGTGSAVVGGIIGKMDGGNLSYSFNYGAVSAAGTAGGLVGEMTSANVNSTYNTGKVVGTQAGGLVGTISNVQLQYSFNGGFVELPSADSTGNAYAIAGAYSANVVLSNVFYNSDKVSFANPDAKGLTSSKMYVAEDGIVPDMMRLIGAWTYEKCTDQTDADGKTYYYYPQISAFHNNGKTVQISRDSVKLIDSNNNPVTPTDTFNVTYYSGDTVFSTDTFKLGETLTPPTVPSKTGYTFDCWCLDEDCTQEYDFASGVPAKDFELYAKWSVNSYEIRYVLNDPANTAKLEGTYNRFVSVENDAANRVSLATSDNAKRPGYAFTGWTFANKKITSIAIEGTDIVFFDNDVRLSETLSLEGLTQGPELYAQWTPIEYSITYRYLYVAEGTSVSNYNRDKFLITDTFALSNATATGYTFKYWTTSADGSESGKLDIIQGRYNDLTLYGVFEANTYRIYFNPGEGKIADADVSKLTLDTNTGLYYATVSFASVPDAEYSNITAEKVGNTCAGWFRTTAGTNKFDFTKPYDIADNVTLFAKYEVQTFVLTVNAGAGAEFDVSKINALNLPEGITVKDVGTQSYKLNGVPYGANVYAYLVIPVNGDASFSGWTNADKALVVTADAEITAQFNAGISVIFSYKGKTASVSVTSDVVTPPTDTALEGYTFEGWYRDSAFTTQQTDFTAASFTAPTVLFAKYTPKTVTVTLQFGDPCTDDEITLENKTLTLNYDSVFATDLPVYNGYDFAGWFLGNESVVGARLGDLALTPTGDGSAYTVTFTAHWNPESYTIGYDYNGGAAVSGATYPNGYTYAGTFSGVQIPAAEREGYDFAGWELNGKALDSTTVGGVTVYTLPSGQYGNVTLRARWTIKTYTVTYNAGLGTFVGATGAGYSADGKTYTVTVSHNGIAPRPVNPVLEGHSFTGWKNLPDSIRQNITADAEYDTQEYTVYFIGNGGTVSTAKINVKYGENIAAAITANGVTEPTYIGHTFDHWQIVTGDTPLTNDTTMPAYDLTLTAEWTVQTLTVTVNCPDTAAATAIENIYKDSEGISVSVSDSKVTLTVPYGTTLVALNNISSAGNSKKLIFQKDSAQYDFASVTANLTLTASWTDTVQTVTLNGFYNKNTTVAGHEQVLSYALAPAGSSATQTLPIPSLQGYTFEGWYFKDGTGDNDWGTQVTSVTVTDTPQTLVFYAKWVAEEYDIEYALNGGTHPTEDYIKTYTVESHQTLLTPTRSGYNFEGWYKNAGLTIPLENNNTAGSLGKLNVFAKWSPKVYEITITGYRDNGGNTADQTVTLTYGNSADALNAYFTRPYHSVTFTIGGDAFNQLGATVSALDELYEGKFTPVEITDENNKKVKKYTATITADYVAVSYRIDFYGESEGMTYSYGDETAVEITKAYTKTPETGKEFEGWNVLIGDQYSPVDSFTFIAGTVTFLKDNAAVTTYEAGSVITLYATFVNKQYTVTFDKGEGDVEGNLPDPLTLDYGAYEAIPEMKATRKGYTFAGWSATQGATVADYADKGAIKLTQDEKTLTLYAVWTADVYTITYVLNGGTNGANPSTYSISANDILIYDATRLNYTFGGWYTDPSFDESKKLPTKKISADAESVVAYIVAESTGNLTLYAKFDINTYTVTITCPDANAAAKIQEQYPSATVSDKVVTLTAEHGSTLDKLNNIVDGTNKLIVKKGTEAYNYTPIAEKLDLTAEWSATIVTVTLKNFYGLGVDESNHLKITYAANSGSQQLPNPSAIVGYKFGGWYDIQKNKFESVSTATDVTLYAEWTAERYSIIYTVSNGTQGNNTSTYTIETAITLQDADANAGYKFEGWYDNSSFTGDRITEIAKGSTGEKRFYAKITPVSYTIKYELNGGTNNASNPATYTTETPTIVLQDASKTGYDFIGWYSDAACTDNMTEISVNSTGDKTLYAKWKATDYTIEYELDNGTNPQDPNPPTGYTIESENVTLPTPTRTGYTFGGWYENSGLTGTAVTEIVKGSTGHKTFYAKWTANQYTITIANYQDNNGDTANKTVTLTYGGSADELNAYFTRPYHTVTFKIGSEQFAQLGDTVPALETMYAGVTHTGTNQYSATLTATYTAIEYYVNFDGKADADRLVYSFTTQSVEGLSDKEKYPYTQSVPEGQEFVGWRVTTGGIKLELVDKLTFDPQTGKVNFTKGDTLVATFDVGAVITLYGYVQTIQYVVSFDTGVTGYTVDSMTLNYGEYKPVATLDNIRNTGYEFAGWSTSQNGTPLSYPVGSMIMLNGGDRTIALYAVWTPISYKITYNNCGEGVTNTNPAAYTIEDETITLQAPARNGYTFKGWYSDAAYTETNKVTEITAGSHENKTFYAKWEKETYTITYNNGTCDGNALINSVTNPNTAISYDVTSATITLIAATCDGYTFLGWFDGNGKVESIEQGSTGNVALTAHWELTEYTITYHLYGNVTETANYTISDQAISLVATATRTGYTFQGWFENDSLTGSAVTAITAKSTGDKDFYAKWEAVEYTITYVIDGSTDSTAKYTIETGATLLTVSARTGYNFSGWYDNADLTGTAVTEIAAGSTGDKTFYAEWTAKTWNVTFVGADDCNLPETKLTFNQSTTLPKVADNARTGYNFLGWATTDGGEKVYDNGATLDKVTAEITDLTLYAKWKAQEYDITYDLKDANWNKATNPNPEKYTIEQTVELQAPTLKGYTFVAWYTDEQYTNAATSISQGSTGDKMFYAKWTQDSYSITYNLNGGTNHADNPAVYAISKDGITLKDATKDGYDFAGWYTDSEFTNALADNKIAALQTGTLTLYADWTLHNYGITYNFNVEEGNHYPVTDNPNPATYAITNDTIVLKAPTRKGYDFGGWVSDGYVVTAIPKGSTGDKTFTATWTPTVYDITFMIGDTVYSTATYTVESSVSFPTVSENIGYDFNGWYADAACTGDKVTSIDTTACQALTFYAKWEPHVYKITYHDNFNGGEFYTETFTVENAHLREAPKHTYSHYDFEGWYTLANGGDNMVSIANRTEDITLYAHWTPHNYSITYVIDGVETTDTGNPISYTVVGGNVTLQTLTRNGYTFKGWCKDADCKKDEITELTVSADTIADVTLYAKWTADEYTITYYLTKEDIKDGKPLENPGNPANYTIETETINLQSIARNGYTFVAWYDAESNSAISTIAQGSTGNKILYAGWTEQVYYITYNLNSGINADGNPASYKITDGNITLVNATRKGYTPDGWYTDADCTEANKVTTIITSNCVDVTLYAKWTPTTCELSFSDDSGTYTLENITLTFDVTVNLPSVDEIERTGYTFAGWATTSGGAVVYGNGDAITLTEERTAWTLYAVWTENTYTITYNNLNDGANAASNPASYTITGGADGKIALSKATRTGYDFDGWYTKDGSGNDWGESVTEITVANCADVTLYAKWTATPYTITYNLNGGTNPGGTPTTYTIESDTITLPVPTRNGYTFVAWYIDEGFTVAASTTILHGSTGHKTYFAKWNLVTYSITYKLNGNTYNVASYTAESEDITLADLHITGYTFNGWYADAELKNKVTVISKGSYDHKTFYATTTPIEYSIKYYITSTQQSTDTGNPATYTIESDPITLQDATRAGYRFEGWYTDTAYTEANKVTVIARGSYEDKTLYAKWSEPIEYKITYMFKGNPVTTTNPQTYNVESADITLATISELTGYTFVSWCTDEACKNKVENVAIPKGSTGEKTFYVDAKAVEYYIDYYPGDGAANDPSNPAKYTVEDLITLQDATRNGYTFLGWYYNNSWTGDVVSEIAKGTTGNKTLYAKWTPTSYTISYTLNGGVNDAANPNGYNVETETVTLKGATRTGYDFGGWYDNIGLTGNEVTQIVKGTTGSKTLYAKWTPHNYAIVYDHLGNGGINHTANPATYTIETETVTLQDATRRGYTFRGWYSDAAHTLRVISIAKGTIGDRTLYALWTADTYNITYTLNGGTNNAANPATYTIENGTITLHNATRKGYTFDGWFTDADFVNAVQTIDATQLQNVTLFAKWTAIGYTLHFDSNGGSAVDTRVVNLETNATVELVTPTQAGIDFRGWSLQDSQQQLYLGSVSLIDIIPANENDRDIYLVAIWANAGFLIYYDFDGGATSVNLLKYHIINAPFDLPSFDDVSKTNYVLVQWIVCSYSDGKEIGRFTVSESNKVVSLTESKYLATDVLVKAVWEPIPVEHVKVEDNNATVKVEDKEQGATKTFDFAVEGGVYDGSVQVKLNGTQGFEEMFAIWYGTPKASAAARRAARAATSETIVFGDYDWSRQAPVDAGNYKVLIVYKHDGDENTVSPEVKNYAPNKGYLVLNSTIEKAENTLTVDFNESPVQDTPVSLVYGDRYDFRVNATNSDGALVTEYLRQNAVIDKPSDAGTYQLRISVAESKNYNGASKVVEFKILPKTVQVPELGIVSIGDGKNDVYTGQDLTAAVNGYDRLIMSITYSGTAIPQGDNVSVVARNAGTYEVKFALVDSRNYVWANDAVIKEGFAVKEWTVERRVVELPKQAEEDFSTTGLYLTFLPEGFDESLMTIEENVGVFAGDYEAFVGLIDPDNYVWSNGSTDKISYAWRIVGINKIFVAIVVGGVAVLGASAALSIILIVRNKRRKSYIVDDVDTTAGDASDTSKTEEESKQDTTDKKSKKGDK